MSWLQLRFSSNPQQAPQLEDALLEAGAGAVTMVDAFDEPVLEPGVGERPLWSHTQVVGLFVADTPMEPVLAYLQECLGEALPEYKLEILEDKDWVREWMTHFKPMQFGERLWVVPSWCDAPEASAINLRLDPGLAFGTGTHPTTALCLRWLEAQDLSSTCVLDYGCGSGILGIAALLLGAERALGVDIDPQALRASQDNLERNALAAERFPVYLPEQLPQGFQADVVVANILAGPLVSLAPQISACVRPGGRLALSGILHSQAAEVLAAYAPYFDLDPIAQEEDWVRLSGIRR